MKSTHNSKKELEGFREEFRTYNHEHLEDCFTEDEVSAFSRYELIKLRETVRYAQKEREDEERRLSSPEYLEFLELCKSNGIHPSDTDLYEYTYKVTEIDNKGNAVLPFYNQTTDVDGNVLPYQYTTVLAKYQKDADRQIIDRYKSLLQYEVRRMHLFKEYTEKYVYELVMIEAFYGEFSRVPQTSHIDIKSSGVVRFVDKYYDAEGRLLN